jgi:hypothetical protein
MRRLATKVATLSEVAQKTPESIKQEAQLERNKQNAQAAEEQRIYLIIKPERLKHEPFLKHASVTKTPTPLYNEKQRAVLSKLKPEIV